MTVRPWRVSGFLFAVMWAGPLAGQPVTARIELDRDNLLPAQSVEAHISVDLTTSEISLGAYQAKLTWDPAVLALTRIGEGETFAFQGPLTRLGDSELTFSHFSVNGADGLVSLSKPQFQVVGAAGDSTQLTLAFEALAAAGSFENLLPQLAVIPAVARVAAEELAPITSELSLSADRLWNGTEVDVEVTVRMPPGNEKLGAYEAFLSWDADVLELAEIHDGNSNRFLDPQTRETGDGGLMFANFSVDGAGGTVSLLNVTFNVIGNEGDRTSVALHYQVLDAAGTFANLRQRLEIVPAIIDVIATPVPHSPDFNGDDFVDIDDFFMFSDAFGTTDEDFDIDGDGVVGWDDYFRFADAYGRPSSELD